LEEIVPSRRRSQKGSFAGKLDDLVIHFPHQPSASKPGSRKGAKRPKPKIKTPACVNRVLLDERTG